MVEKVHRSMSTRTEEVDRSRDVGRDLLEQLRQLPVNDGSEIVNPVALPLGRAMLVTSPSRTGSKLIKKTIGMLGVFRSRVTAAVTPG